MSLKLGFELHVPQIVLIHYVLRICSVSCSNPQGHQVVWYKILLDREKRWQSDFHANNPGYLSSSKLAGVVFWLREGRF